MPHHELSVRDDPDGLRWATAIEPLADLFVRGLARCIGESCSGFAPASLGERVLSGALARGMCDATAEPVTGVFLIQWTTTW